MRNADMFSAEGRAAHAASLKEQVCSHVHSFQCHVHWWVGDRAGGQSVIHWLQYASCNDLQLQEKKLRARTLPGLQVHALGITGGGRPANGAAAGGSVGGGNARSGHAPLSPTPTVPLTPPAWADTSTAQQPADNVLVEGGAGRVLMASTNGIHYVASSPSQAEGAPRRQKPKKTVT
jgi:hypothetical protein